MKGTRTRPKVDAYDYCGVCGKPNCSGELFFYDYHWPYRKKETRSLVCISQTELMQDAEILRKLSESDVIPYDVRKEAEKKVPLKRYHEIMPMMMCYDYVECHPVTKKEQIWANKWLEELFETMDKEEQDYEDSMEDTE